MKITKCLQTKLQFSLTTKLVSTLVVISNKHGLIATPLVVYVYVAPSASASTVYANIVEGGFLVGSAKVSGGGYHKASSAIQRAFDSAGIITSENIAGCGDAAITRVLHGYAINIGLYSHEFIVKEF